MPALEKLTIDTPEQIALEFPLASVGSRFLALAIDTLIQVGASPCVGLLVGAAVPPGSRSSLDVGAGTWVLAVLVLGLFLIYYGYFAVFEAVWNGQTPGKRMIGLRVITTPAADQRPTTRSPEPVRIVDQMPGIYAVGILSVFVTERNQRLGDLAAGTVVVHERAVSAEEINPFTVEAPTPTTASTRHGASKLTAAELSVIDLYFRRREQLDGHARLRAARQIADRMRTRLEITSAIGDEQLLEELSAESRERGRYR